MDVHVRNSVVTALRRRQVDVLTAQNDNSRELSDPLLLDRAHALSRVLFTQDDDLLAEASHRQASGEVFSGIIYGHQQNITVRQTIDDLELLAKACEPEELANSVMFLPLK
jgi:hypothetical protein